MTPVQLSALLIELLALPQETEWVEWKHNHADPDKVGTYLSALPNSAALHGKDRAYLVWGIEDGTKNVIGTTFKPRKAKGKGNEELENWLMRGLHPQVDFKIHEWSHQAKSIVLFEIPRASHAPIRWGSEAFIRVGTLTKKLREYPAKESALWASFSKNPFERGIAKADLPGDEVLAILDFAGCFDLLKAPAPTDQKGILTRLAEEGLIVRKPGKRFDIANLGAILFAKNLSAFDRLSRKALRIIKYKGNGRTEMEREWRDAPAQKGYAVVFEPAVAFINSQLPQNEPIGKAFRSEVRMYPEIAIRELVANALIHQDFTITGAGPMIEIFPDRMEITNPGEPLVDTLRFIDAPPRSRNEEFAAMMRRMKICEEGGTGIDKVIKQVEMYQLPAPDFEAPLGSTKATLFAYQKLKNMDTKDRIRACYQHACLCHVSNQKMMNATVRKRFGIQEKNAAKASRMIAEAVEAGRIKLADPNQGKKYASYLPFWA